MDAAWLAGAGGFALAMSATPGPNNAIVAASAARFGLRRTMPAIVGVALGFPAMLLLVSLGAGAALQNAPALQSALRWAGIAWLLWLAWTIAAAPVGAPPRPDARPPRAWTMAALQWANPKAWTAAIGATLGFVGAAPIIEAATLASLFAAAALLSLVAWAALGAGLAPWLRRSARAERGFNLAMAGLLVASVAALAAG